MSAFAPSKQFDTEEAAAAWLAHFRSGEASAETDAFHDWVSAHPDHAAAWERVTAAWDMFGDELRNDPQLELAVTEARQYALRARRISRLAKAGIAAATAAAAAIVIAIAGISPSRPATDTAAIAYNSTTTARHIDLSDGSEIELKRGTGLVVIMGASERSIAMRSGTATFKVARDSRRPFVVKAAGYQVTAVGTRFTVELAGGDGRVILHSGKVRVTGPKGERQLAAGESLSFRRDGTFSSALQTKLNFDQTPLQQAVREVNARGDRQIVIADPRIRDLKISGSFESNNSESFVRAVTMLYDIDSERSESGIILLKSH